MQLIVPMAGYGKRLRPHTYSRPKPLICVAGEPLLKHVLDSLKDVQIDEFIFIVGYLGDQIEQYIKDNYRVKSTFIVQEEMIGQAHAIYLTREHLAGQALVLFADTLFEADLSVIQTTDSDGIAFVQEVEDPRRFGVVELNGDGQVTRFIEKPSSVANKNAVIGLYYLRDSAHMIRAIEKQMTAKAMTRGEFFLTDAFQIMVDDGAAFRTQPVSVWLDCGQRDTLLLTNRYLLEHHRDNSGQANYERTTIVPPVNIHPSAKINNSIIGPYTSIGADCQIEDSIIRDSIIDSDVRVARSMLEHSLIGRNAVVTGRFQSVNLGDESSVGFD